MSDLCKLVQSYAEDVQFPEVSGFEVLEMLDIRTEIALRERELNKEEINELEEADRKFFQNLHLFYASLEKVANLAEMRRQGEILPSHWWWYLDELVKVAA